MDQTNIKKTSTTYSISATYHSEKKCQNYDAEITGIELPNGDITLKPSNTFFPDDGFKFIESDPDRVIAIAQMMISFAQMVKNQSKITIDNENSAC